MIKQSNRRVRFISGQTDTLKRGKRLLIAKASLEKWSDYTEAEQAMFFHTDTADADQVIVTEKNKKGSG